ncbi:hypothetical protein [Ilumatobacter sp.]|uniref:hypothetical protein n=1 Tax=Ilumatobacter sp. TaxID=1967498 RepID=UPI003AF6563E
MNERDRQRDEHALDERLGLDAIAGAEVPDQWDEIVQRAGDSVGLGVDHPAKRSRTPVWLAAAAAVVAVVVGSIVLLAPDDGSIRTTVDQPTPTTDSTGPTADSSVPAATEPNDAPSTSAPAVVPVPGTSVPRTGGSTAAPTTAPTTVPAAEQALAASPRWAAACAPIVGEPGSAPVSEDVGPFDVLAPTPSLRIDVPATGSAAGSESALSTDELGIVHVDVVPGGVAVVVDGPRGEAGPDLPSIVAVVDRDGSIRWRRCVDIGASEVFVASPDRAPGAVYVGGSGQVVALALDTGEPVPIDATLAGVDLVEADGRYALLADGRPIGPDSELLLLDGVTGEVQSLPPAPAEAGDGELIPGIHAPADEAPVVSLQPFDDASHVVFVDGVWSADPDTIAAALPLTLAYAEDGMPVFDGANRLVLTIDGYRDPQREGFSAITDGETIIADDCVEEAELGCARERFVAYDVATGDELWSHDEAGAVLSIENGLALAIGGNLGDQWAFIDPRTGEPVDDTRWTGAFSTECCGGDDYTHTGQEGGVVWQVDWTTIEVFWRPGLSAATSTADLAGADPTG